MKQKAEKAAAMLALAAAIGADSGAAVFSRAVKQNKFAGIGEGEKVLARRRANIAAGKVQVSE